MLGQDAARWFLRVLTCASREHKLRHCNQQGLSEMQKTVVCQAKEEQSTSLAPEDHQTGSVKQEQKRSTMNNSSWKSSGSSRSNVLTRRVPRSTRQGCCPKTSTRELSISRSSLRWKVLPMTTNNLPTSPSWWAFIRLPLSTTTDRLTRKITTTTSKNCQGWISKLEA